jgi:hypothetical protein
VGVYILNVYLGKDNFDLLFQAINTVALFIVGAYVFKKHAIPVIQEGIALDRNELQQLHNQSDALNSRKHLLEQRLGHQHELVTQLGDKIHQWRAMWLRKNKEKELEQQAIHERLVEKRKIQSHYATRNRVYKEVAVAAITRARESLEQQFSSSQAGEDFLGAVMEHLRKEKQ